MVMKKGYEDAEEIIQPLSNLKINEEEILQPIEECLWDVLTGEILPRLSAKQLQTFKIVCKNWLHTISSTYFVGLHLKLYNQSQIRVLMPNNHGGTLIEYKINCDEETELQIPYPTATINRRVPKILGSCDGLLCLLLDLTIAVYNPSTGECFWLQPPLKDYRQNCSWFGHHPCSGEYVLVLGDLYSEFGVYKFSNSRSNSKLEKIQSTSTLKPQGFYGFCEETVGTLLHGALHWPVECYYDFGQTSFIICAYHLDDNKYFEISTPIESDYTLLNFKLGVVEGCLFALFTVRYDYSYDDEFYCYNDNDNDNVIELRIMKEYKVQQSWTEYDYMISGFRDCLLSPLGFFRNGDVILNPNNKSGLINYTFNDNKSLLLVDSNEAIICADSLVSPEIVAQNNNCCL